MVRRIGFALFVFACVPRAHAAASFDACAGYIESLPAVIGTQGVWCLRKDLATSLSSGHTIQVTTNNVTIDCNGYKIGGLAGGPNSIATGIYATSRSNTTIRGCLLRGFAQGIFLENAVNARIEDNVVEGSYAFGIRLHGDGGLVQRNRVLDTGRAPLFGESATAIYVGGANDIVDNTVIGVQQTYVSGIVLAFGGGGSVDRNRVRGLASVNTATGIAANTSPGAFICDNLVAGPGTYGIACDNGEAVVTDNVVSRFAFNIQTDCRRSGNVEQPVE